MKNKIIRFAILLVVCVLVWVATAILHLIPNPKTADFLRGFSMGMGFFAALMLIYHSVTASNNKNNSTTIS